MGYEVELFVEQVPIDLQIGNFTHLLCGENNDVMTLDYGCGPTSALIPPIYGHKVNEDKEKNEKSECDNESMEVEDVQSNEEKGFEFPKDEDHDAKIYTSFLAIHEVIKRTKRNMWLWMRKVVTC